MLCYALEKAVVLVYLAVLKDSELSRRGQLFIPARAVFDQDGFDRLGQLISRCQISAASKEPL